ncbi:M24 family metallopeptidase [Roseinatronobacter sp.]
MPPVADEYACCTSVNHLVCHGFPNAKKLRDGDIVNVDVTLILDGWSGDSSRMYAVGKPKGAAERLVGIAHKAMINLGRADHDPRRRHFLRPPLPMVGLRRLVTGTH